MPNLYYTNSTEDGLWATLANWNTAADGSGDIATAIPWSVTGGGYYDYDLVDASGGQGVDLTGFSSGGMGASVVDESYVPVVQTCNISNINFRFHELRGGIWTGDSCQSINQFATWIDGTFEGDNWQLACAIVGGTFSGDNLTYTADPSDEYVIYGGTFSGDNLTINTTSSIWSAVRGGTFSGQNITNNAWVRAGTWNIASITNNYFMDNPALSVNLDGTPYTGIWNGAEWVDGVCVGKASSGGGSSGRGIISQLLRLPFPINI